VVSNVVENGAVESTTLLPSGRVKRTLVTVPSASAALADTVIVPLTVEPAVGEVIDTVGGWLLLITVIDALAVCVDCVPAPVTVKFDDTEPAVAAAVRVNVELLPAVTVAGLKLAVTPAGRPGDRQVDRLRRADEHRGVDGVVDAGAGVHVLRGRGDRDAEVARRLAAGRELERADPGAPVERTRRAHVLLRVTRACSRRSDRCSSSCSRPSGSGCRSASRCRR